MRPLANLISDNLQQLTERSIREGTRTGGAGTVEGMTQRVNADANLLYEESGNDAQKLFELEKEAEDLDRMIKTLETRLPLEATPNRGQFASRDMDTIMKLEQ